VVAATSNLEEAYQALEREEEVLQRQLTELQVSKASLARLIGVSPSLSRATVSLEYQGLGPVEAAERLLKEKATPLTTREIVDGMTERGWTTRSRNAVATVYATLTNAKKKFERKAEASGEGKWELKAD
jgi:hypothetical protein